MNEKYKVVIIGGGAAGILCAIELLSCGKFLPSDIAVLEKNDRIGKKLLATGNGQGNLTNTFIGEKNYYGKKEFVKAAVENVKAVNLSEYFYKISLPVIAEENGKVYPISKQASAVLDILRMRLIAFGVDVITGFRVEKIQKEDGIFTITSKNERFFSEYVIAAFGGKAAKNFGTDGSAYSLLTPFGHKVTELFPSLVQLKTDKEKIKGLSGIKEKAKISAYDGDVFLGDAIGDLLFTDYGVSGNTVFSLSAKLTDKISPKLKVEFLPQYSPFELENLLADKKKFSPYLSFEELVIGLINKKVGERIIKNTGANTIKELAFALKNYFIDVTGNMGFDYAQVTKGGIDTDDVDKITYESKKSANLFIVGEALDIDGDCGGYNLSFAFTSGIIAAREIARRIS